MPAPLVLTSRYLQTNTTVLALGGGQGALVVDAPYFPDELDHLARLARDAAAGGPVRLFATHAHHDHLMGRLALPGAPLLACASTAAALRDDPDKPRQDLANQDAETYVRRTGVLVVDDVEATDAPAEGMTLIEATGHTGDGCALLAPDLADGVLCCADHLSDVEVPLLSWAGSLPAYRATLDRLEEALRTHGPRLVVPGHGSPTDTAGALDRLEQDRAYLEELPRGDPDQPLPPDRDTPRQREIHRANLERHG